MKHPVASGMRRLQAELRRQGVAREMTPEERTMIQAGINLRGAKGAYRDAYTAEDLDLLSRARKIARDHGQAKAAMFMRVGPRVKKRWEIGIPDAQAFHACPRCGTYHADKGLHKFDPKKIRIQARVLLNVAREERRREQQERLIARTLEAERRKDELEGKERP